MAARSFTMRCLLTAHALPWEKAYILVSYPLIKCTLEIKEPLLVWGMAPEWRDYRLGGQKRNCLQRLLEAESCLSKFMCFEVLTLWISWDRTVFGNGVLKEVIKVNWEHMDGPWSNMTGILKRRENLDTDMDRGRTMWSHREKMAVYKSRGDASEEINLDLRLLFSQSGR